MEAEPTDLVLGPNQEERELYIRDLAAAARNYKSVLGGKSAVSESNGASDPRGADLSARLEALNREGATFSPVLEVYPLTENHFQLRKVKIPAEIADLWNLFDFYLLNVPVTLVPQSGWGFTELECSIELNENESPERRPVAHEVFPKEEWQNMIRASQGLSVGLDENLRFKADGGDLINQLPGISGTAGVKGEVKAEAGLVIGPFKYNIRRPRIIARGRGDVKVYWRLSGEESLETDDLRLGIVAKVPKSVPRFHATGVLKATRNFKVLTADLSVLLKYVREKTKNFFEQGAPLTGTMTWPDVTAQVRGD